MRLPGLLFALCVSVPAAALVSASSRLSNPAATPATQNPPAAVQEPQQPIRVQVELVGLFATARDRKKHIVNDLTQDDFRIFEDSTQQKVAFFSKETAQPITLGLLMDTSGSVEGVFQAEQEAASRFLARVLRPKDLAMIVTFDVDVNLLADFTADHGQLDRAIQRAQINAPRPRTSSPGPFPTILSGGTNFYDAVYLACHDKLGGEAGRKALVILTDAFDTGSKVTLEEALETAQRTNTVIHILFISDPRYQSDYGVAKKFAEATGGRVIQVSSEKKLLQALDEISEELRNQYLLGYYPSNTTRDGRFRKIKVETTRDGVKVLTRKGYYAPRK